MANLSRRKSIRRYWRLWPPPCHRFVMWPLLLRPPVRFSGSTNDFSGVVLVTSAKSETERNRVAGVTGLNWRMPISALEHLDRVAFLEGHDRLFPGRPHAGGPPVGAAPSAHDERAHVRDGDLEERFDRRLDLRLGRPQMHPERVLLASLVGRRGLLGDHRPDDRLVQLRHRSSPPPPPPPPPSPPPPRLPAPCRAPLRRPRAPSSR